MRKPPVRACAECGRNVGRRWRDYVLCAKCRSLTVGIEPGWTRRARIGGDDVKAKGDPVGSPPHASPCCDPHTESSTTAANDARGDE